MKLLWKRLTIEFSRINLHHCIMVILAIERTWLPKTNAEAACEGD